MHDDNIICVWVCYALSQIFDGDTAQDRFEVMISLDGASAIFPADSLFQFKVPNA